MRKNKIEILNEENELTVKRIHLLVTDLCSRNCPNCCNKCYSLNDVPVVTDEELSKLKISEKKLRNDWEDEKRINDEISKKKEESI